MLAENSFESELRGRRFKFESAPGLFSRREIDPGSRLLIDQLNPRPDTVSIDIGCGYGPIGLVLAHLEPQGQAHLVDRDFVAVEVAARNAELNGLANVTVYLSDAFSRVPDDTQFALAVSNLPANTDNLVIEAIISGASDHLQPTGQLTIVCVARIRPYVKRQLDLTFGQSTKLAATRTHVVLSATKS